MKTSVSPAELKMLRDRNESVSIIDVRSAEEFNTQHIPLAENIPVSEIETGSFIPAENTMIITVCGKGGGRSERAAEILRKYAGAEVYFLEGGTIGWYENSGVK